MNISESILKYIERELEIRLQQCGVMFHIFSRVKKEKSINIKLESKKEEYKNNNKKMQDLLALRITLYFSDDVEIIYRYLEKQSIDKSVDENEVDRFCPKRLNLIMQLPDHKISEFRFGIKHIGENAKLIDDTYEIQIRTILSEGWHEVEHDLRYKCKGDWDGFDDESRHLNGIYATLENAEWSMLTLFEKLSYSHYKKNNWDSMMRNKMRLRFADHSLSKEVSSYLNDNNKVAKKIFRVDRRKVVNTMLVKGFTLPLTFDTVIHLLNYLEVKDKGLEKLADTTIIQEFSNLYDS